jgi:hypothetical protein
MLSLLGDCAWFVRAGGRIAVVWSSCSSPHGTSRGCLAPGPDWPLRWKASWRAQGGEVVCAVRDLGSVPAGDCESVRRFSWRARQRHRPGLQFTVSTGRHHGFESLEEQRLLLALDFLGNLAEVLPQPFRLTFATAGGVASTSLTSWPASMTARGGSSMSGRCSWSALVHSLRTR